MDESTSKNKSVIAIVGILVIVAALGIGIAASNGSKNTASVASPSPAPSAVSSASSSPAVQSATTAAYKDGSYTATGQYDSPGGRESITISVTLQAGNITATNAVSGSTNPTGKTYQSQFISGYQAEVVGKSIDELNVTRVSGSSLTSRGFNAAIEQIKSQAKA